MGQAAAVKTKTSPSASGSGEKAKPADTGQRVLFYQIPAPVQAFTCRRLIKLHDMSRFFRYSGGGGGRLFRSDCRRCDLHGNQVEAKACNVRKRFPFPVDPFQPSQRHHQCPAVAWEGDPAYLAPVMGRHSRTTAGRLVKCIHCYSPVWTERIVIRLPGTGCDGSRPSGATSFLPPRW
jgi:hypothetical protein